MDLESREDVKFEDIPADCFSIITSFFDDPFMVENFLMLNRRMYSVMYSETYMNFENVTFDLVCVIRMINCSNSHLFESSDVFNEFTKITKYPFISKLYVRRTHENIFCKYKNVLRHCLVNLRTIYIPDLFRTVRSWLHLSDRVVENPVEIREIFETINSFSSKELCLGMEFLNDGFSCVANYNSDILKNPESTFSRITRLEIIRWKWEVVEISGRKRITRTNEVNFFKFFPNVVTIDAENTNLFTFESNTLKYCEFLRNLRICDSEIIKPVFHSFPKTLKALCLERIQNAKKDNICNKDFSGLDNLEELTLYMWPDLVDFQFLKNLKHLKLLDLSRNTFSERRGSQYRKIKERKFELLRLQQERTKKEMVVIFLCSSSSCPGSDLRTIQICEGRNKEDETTIYCCSKMFCGRCDNNNNKEKELEDSNICGSCKKNVLDLCWDCSVRECMYCVICENFTCGNCSLRCESSVHLESETFKCCCLNDEDIFNQRIICKKCQKRTSSECDCGKEKACGVCISKKMKTCSYCGERIGCYIICKKCSKVICGGCKSYTSISTLCLNCK